MPMLWTWRPLTRTVGLETIVQRYFRMSRIDTLYMHIV